MWVHESLRGYMCVFIIDSTPGMLPRPVRRIFEGSVTKLVMNTYFTLIMVKNHIITN